MLDVCILREKNQEVVEILAHDQGCEINGKAEIQWYNSVSCPAFNLVCFGKTEKIESDVSLHMKDLLWSLEGGRMHWKSKNEQEKE